MRRLVEDDSKHGVLCFVPTGGVHALFLLRFDTAAFEGARTAFGDDNLGATVRADVHFPELVGHTDIFSS